MILTLLCLFAFFAGFVDSVVGGGGLIQLPALLLILPEASVPALLGTNKFSSIFGTSFAIWRYSKKNLIHWSRFLVILSALAFVCSYLGAHAVSLIPKDMVRPFVIVVLLAIFAYTFFRKDFGHHSSRGKKTAWQLTVVFFLSALIGFYDGFIGPGTGGFFIFLFVSRLGLNFLEASAKTKVINVATNLAALIYFVSTDQVLYQWAVPMAACNVLGSYVGTHIALKKGSAWVRYFFLFVVLAILLKLLKDTLSP